MLFIGDQVLVSNGSDSPFLANVHETPKQNNSVKKLSVLSVLLISNFSIRIRGLKHLFARNFEIFLNSRGLFS